MKEIKKTSIIIMSIFSLVQGQTAKEHSKIIANNHWDISLDVFNRYVWRGTDYGNSPSIQPGITYTAGSFTFGGWSAWQFSGEGNENDLFVSLDIGSFTLTVTDYFFPSNSGERDNFFNVNSDSGAHFMEAGISGELNGIEVTSGYFFLEPGSDVNSLYLSLSYGHFLVGLGNGLYTTVDKENGDDVFDIVELGVTASKDAYSCSWILNPNQEPHF